MRNVVPLSPRSSLSFVNLSNIYIYLFIYVVWINRLCFCCFNKFIHIIGEKKNTFYLAIEKGFIFCFKKYSIYLILVWLHTLKFPIDRFHMGFISPNLDPIGHSMNNFQVKLLRFPNSYDTWFWRPKQFDPDICYSCDQLDLKSQRLCLKVYSPRSVYGASMQFIRSKLKINICLSEWVEYGLVIDAFVLLGNI